MSVAITFSCLVSGSHNVTLNWIKHGEGEVVASSRILVIQRSVNATFHSLVLEFIAVELSDTGIYTCHANNVISQTGPSATDTSQGFYLYVQSEFTCIGVHVLYDNYVTQEHHWSSLSSLPWQ